jgi:hypothetical protein
MFRNILPGLSNSECRSTSRGQQTSMDELEVSTIMGIGGFVVGLLFGALTHRTNFCTMPSQSLAAGHRNLDRGRACAAICRTD